MSKDLFEKVQENLNEVKELCFNGELSNLDALIEMRKAKAEAEKVLETVKQFEDDKINEIAREAEQYNGKFKGYEIKAVNGRKTYSFKGINEIQEIEAKKKEAEQKYISAFDGFQKGTVQTIEENGVLYWIDSNSEMQLFPEINYGKSYLTVKESKK